MDEGPPNQVPQANGSPPRRRRRLNGPSSSSVRRRKVKAGPCSFCHRAEDVFSLEAHLVETDYCRNLYMRHFKVSSMDAVLVKVFDCIYCPAKFNKISDHLRTHPVCKERYYNKFNVQDVK